MAVPKRFNVVRFFGVFMKIVAWIVLIVSVLGAVGMALLGSSSAMTQFAASFAPFLTDMMSFGAGASLGIVGAVTIIIAGIINFLIFYFFGELIHMGLAVEENTRLDRGVAASHAPGEPHARRAGRLWRQRICQRELRVGCASLTVGAHSLALSIEVAADVYGVRTLNLS